MSDDEGGLAAKQRVVAKRRFSPLTGAPVPDGFPAGVSGNPAGRQPMGASILEWFNQMKDWSEPKTKAARAKVEGNAKAIAANLILLARTDDKNIAGNPTAIAAIKEVIDRTAGKAVQRVEVAPLDPQTIDLTRLSIEQVAMFRELLAKACGKPLPPEQRQLDNV